MSGREQFSVTRDLLLSPDTVVQEQLSGYRQMDPGWKITDRILDEYLIYYLVSGTVRGWLGDKEVLIRPSALFWMAPREPHRFVGVLEGGEQLLMYHFRFKLFNQRLDMFRENGFLLREGLGDSRSLLVRYYDEVQVRKPDLGHRLRSILYLLLSDGLNQADVGAESGATLNQATRSVIFEFARDNLRRRPKPAELADVVGLSHDYFSRVFRQSFGMSPQRWLVQYRVRAIAENLINSAQSISEIALDYGYDDIFFFSRQFKQVMGMSPRAWRQEKRGGQKMIIHREGVR